MVDRWARQFETKVQRQVVVQDDEISRQAEHLAFVEAQIAAVRDSLQRFDLQAEAIQTTAEGKARRRDAHRQSQAAKLAADHHLRIQEMEKVHAAAVDQLRTEFEATLAEANGWAQKVANEKTGQLNKEFERVQKQIAGWKAKPAQTEYDQGEDFETLALLQEPDQDRIRELEVRVRDKAAERLQALQRQKEKLAKCLALVEEVEAARANTIEELKRKLDATDADYARKEKAIVQKNVAQIADARQAVEEAQESLRDVENTFATFKKRFAKEVQENAQVAENLLKELSNTASQPQTVRPEVRELAKVEEKLEALRADLRNQEAVLREQRAANSELMCEIGRFKSQVRIAQRRAALQI
jgi:hypothetical protein